MQLDLPSLPPLLHQLVALPGLGLVGRTGEQLREAGFGAIEMAEAGVAGGEVEQGRVGHDGGIEGGGAIVGAGLAHVDECLQQLRGI